MIKLLIEIFHAVIANEVEKCYAEGLKVADQLVKRNKI